MLESPSLFHGFLMTLSTNICETFKSEFILNEMVPYYHKYVFSEC